MVPMDGFHYYRSELDQMPDPALAHARRGAAFTFNARAFMDCVRRIMAASPADGPIAVPSFDHGRGDPVEGDIVVEPHHQLIIVEGLYVLLRASLATLAALCNTLLCQHRRVANGCGGSGVTWKTGACLAQPAGHACCKRCMEARSLNADGAHAEDEPWCELQDLLTEAWMLHVEPSLSLAQVVERQVAIGNTREAACERVGNNDLVNTDAVRLRSRRPHLLIETSAAHRSALQGTPFDYETYRARAHSQAAPIPQA